jgi:hypothetical protein
MKKTSMHSFSKRLLALAALALATLLAAPAAASANGLTFVNRTTANGLGGNTVLGVYADGSAIYAATDGGLSISTDGGTTFTNYTSGLGNNYVAGVFASGSTIYAATLGGLSISTDGGMNFTNRTTTDGLGGNIVLGVYADGSAIYAATDGGLSISTNGGTTFINRTTANGLGNNNVRSVYANGTTVYAATVGGLSISTDGGTTFTNRTTANGLGANWINGVYAVGSSVYAATETMGLSISTNGGANFTTSNATNAGLGNNDVRGVYADGSSIFAATYGGLSISLDGGTTFTNYTSGLGSDVVYGVYAVGSTIYAATAGGLSLTPPPTITPSVSSLGNFTATYGTNSASQSFSVNGSDLTDDITVTTTGDFQVSTDNSSFSANATIEEISGNVTDAIIYVRTSSSAAAGPVSGNVSLSSTGATTQLVALNGTINPLPLTATISAQPIQTRAGSPITSSPTSNQPLVVRFTSNGTAVPGATVNVTVNQNSGNFTGNLSATTDSGGNATFGNMTLTQAAAGYTLTFTASAGANYTTANATSSQFPIIAAAAANAALTTAPGNATYGSTLTPAAVVTLTDLYGNPVSNTNITASLNSGNFTSTSNTTLRTAANGTVTYSNLVPAQAGNFTVIFDPAAAGVANATASVSVATANLTIDVSSANGTASFTIPTPATPPQFTGLVLSDNATSILGANTTYTSTNNTTVAGVYPNALGVETNGPAAANYNITQNRGTLTITAGNASQLTEVAAPVTTEAGRPIEGVNLDTFAPEPPTIFVGDEFGNPVSGITVNATLSTNPGSATLNGTTSETTDGNGTAVFDNLEITKVAEGYKISYDAAGLTTLVSEEFNIEPAAAGNITVTTQPGNTTAGALIPGTTGNISVQVFDNYGNVVNRAYNIKATLITGNFTGTSNATVPTDATGYGTFESLTTNQSGVYQIEFAPLAAGNITVTSANFTVDPDFASANISVSTQPGNSTAGLTIPGTPSGSPTARILDQYGNAIPGYTVDATTNSFTGNFTGTTSETTDATGYATFGNLTQTVAGTPYTLAFSFANATTASNSTTSSGFTVDPAAAAKLVMVTEPSATAQAGIAIAQQPAVKLQDEFGNDVFDTGTSVDTTVNEINALAGGNTTANTVNGTATFSGLTINGTIGNYTLSFNATGLNGTTANTTVELTAGTATQLSTSTQPSITAMANATFSQQPVVQILDAWRNLVITDNSTVVDATLDTGGLSGTLVGTANATATGGNASFSGLKITDQAGNYTLTFNATGLTSNTSNTTTITADLTTANITMGTQPGNATAGSAIPSPSISILDQYNNPVGNYTVNALLNGATLTSNSTRNVATGTDGNASFSNLITNTAGSGYTLAFSFNATIPTTASNSTTSANFTVAPDAAYGLVMVSQPPTTAQAGVPFDDGNAPQVRVKDRFNNNVPQANMTISAMANAVSGGPGNAIVPGNAALTDESGTATFYGLGINGTVGVYTLTFSNGTLTTNTTSNNVTLTPGVATQLFVATQPPATVQANATLTPVVVNLQDAFSNNLTSSNATVSTTLQGGSGSLSGTATSNATSGAATFNDLRIEGLVGNYTLLFQSAGLSNATSSNIEVTADQSTAMISISANATDSTAGQDIQGPPAAAIADQYGNALAGYTVNATINKNTGNFTGTSSATTNATGVAAFGNLTQTVAAADYNLRLSFNQNGASGNATTANFTVNPGNATALSITTQPASTAQAGIVLTTQPVIQVRDAFGNAKPDSGVVVSTTVNEANAAIQSNGTATTDGNGTATFAGLTLNGTAGNYTLDFDATGLTSATSNSIALGAGNATKLVVSTQPGNSTAAGNAFSPQPAVKLHDAWNNDVSQSGVSVTASVTSGSASTGGNLTANTTAGGVATFDGLTIAGTVGNYTLTFNATGLTDATSDTVAVTANPDTAVISISTNATTSTAGQTIAGPPAATIVDGSGNALSGITVNATINKNTGNFTGTTSVSSNATGVASFGNLTQTVAASDYNLMLAFNNGLTSGNATTANFSVTAAAAANMTVVRQPTNTIAGVVIAGAGGGSPTVRLRDTFGNDVASQNVTVTLQTGTLNGTLTVATNASGNATFSNLVCNTVGFYRLSFASGGLSALSNQFDIFAGSATSLVFMNTLQTTAQAGIALDPQPVVQVRDAFGNNVAGTRPISVAASTGSLNGNTTVATNANGTASFSGLALTGTIGSRTLTFSSSGLTSLTSNSITLTAGPAASLVVDVQPASAFIAGDELTGSGGGFPTVTVKDAYNNAVSTTINATGVGFTMFGDGSVTSLPTDGNGTAVFADLMVEQAGNDLRVNFAAGGVSANTDPFNVNPGVPYSMTVTTQPPATVASGVILSPNPAVALKDVFQNTVTSPYEVQVSLGSGNGTLSGTANVTTTSGVATFTDLSIAQLGNYTLSFRTLGYVSELSVLSSQFSVVSPVASGLAITGISATGGGNYEIAFTAQQGGNYWIQRTTDLKNGPWVYVSTTASTATTGVNTPITVTTPGGTKAFWRLTTTQPED